LSETQLKQLEAAIAVQEALRATLGDAAVDAVIAALRAQLEAGQPGVSAPMDSASLEALVAAGDAAAQAHAFAQAEACYARAGELAAHWPEAEAAAARRWQVDLIVRRIRLSIHAESLPAPAPLAEAESLLRDLPASDQARLARVYYWMGRAHDYLNEARTALACYQQVLPIALSLNDDELIGIPSGALGQHLARQGRLDRAEPLLQQALGPLERTANWSHWVAASAALAVTVAGRRHYREGLRIAEQALQRAREWNDPAGVVQSQLALAEIYRLGGEAEPCAAASAGAVRAAQASRDQSQLYLGHLYLAWAESAAGRAEAAEAQLAQMRAAQQRFEKRTEGAELVLAYRALIALNLRRADETCRLAEQAVTAAERAGNLLAEGLAHQAWGCMLTLLRQWEAARAHLAESLGVLWSGDQPLEAARTEVAWGRLCRDSGNIDAAREHFNKALAQFGVSEVSAELKVVLGLLGGL
jgi:hypothetical protein